MAGTKIKGITIELGADTSKFSKAIREVNSQLKTAQTSLKDVNKLLKLDPTNTELLRQKQQLLKNTVSETEEKLKTEKKALEQLSKGEQTKEVVEQQKALKREIIETEQKLKEAEKASREFGTVLKQQMEAAGKKMQEFGGKVTSLGKSLTTKVTLPIVAAFTVAVDSASDYEESLNKLSVAFGEYATKVQDFTDNAQIDFGLSKKDAAESASAFGALAKGIGLSEEQAAEMSVTLTQLSADLGSYFNADIETSAAALEGIFTGNSKALRQFGVVMTDVNLKEFAETLGITSKQFQQLGATDKAILRYQYVLAQTADAQGDFARTNDGTANSMKSLQASIKDLSTVLGEQLLPIVTPIIKKIADFISKLSALDDDTLQMIVDFGLLVAALGPVLTILGNVITIAGGLASAISFLATPMGAVILIIGSVVAAGVALYKNWDWIEAKAAEFRERVLSAFRNVKDGVVNIFTTIKDSVSNQINAAKDAVYNAIEKIKSFFRFEWSLPQIKLPHFSIQGKFSLVPPSVPHLSVEWYKKAMENGMILNSPTIFGAMNGKLLGAGEAGSETIVGTKSLMSMIREASGNGMTVNMTVQGGNVSANELADIVIDKLTQKIQRGNQRW